METVRYLPRTAAPISRYYGDVAEAGSVLVIGGFVFGLLDGILVWLERLQRPTMRDHLRHCVVLYVILVILIVQMISTYENSAAHGISLGYAMAVTAFFAVGYGISIDATMLPLQRWRFDRAPLGGVT